MTAACTLTAKITAAIINPALALIFAIALLVFVYGVVEFMFLASTSKGETQNQGREHMLWGVIGMAIMISAWGILKVIAGTIGVGIGSC